MHNKNIKERPKKETQQSDSEK